jgi:cation:H+ antiporter
LTTTVPLLLVALAVILVAAELFTNGVEWAGVRLGLGHGAVGSVLAAFGTAMPETMIPLIAIIFVGNASADEVGVGAILGAPFLLSTAAFAVSGAGLYLYARRRRHGPRLHLDNSAINRDFTFFFLLYGLGITCTFLPEHSLKDVVAAFLLTIYGVYVYRAVSNSGEAGDEEELEPLRLHRLAGGLGTPPTALVSLQVLAALAGIIGGAYLFVQEVDRASDYLSIPPLALALLISPVATELPETFNSVIWVRQGKDTLAMGNISGAMVFQSSVPVAIGVVFTSWDLTTTALVAAVIAFASTAVVFISLRRRGYLTADTLMRAGLLWVGFVVYVGIRIASGDSG